MNDKEEIIIDIETYLKNSKLQKAEEIAKEKEDIVRSFLMEMKCRYTEKGVYYFSNPYFYIELIAGKKQAIFWMYEYLKKYLKDTKSNNILLKEKIKEKEEIYIKKEFIVRVNDACSFIIYQRYWKINELESITSNSKEEEFYTAMKKRYPLRTMGLRIDIRQIEKIEEKVSKHKKLKE